MRESHLGPNRQDMKKTTTEESDQQQNQDLAYGHIRASPAEAQVIMERSQVIPTVPACSTDPQTGGHSRWLLLNH